MRVSACFVVALAGVLCLAGCGDAVKDADAAAGILTGSTQIKVGREVEREARRLINDHRSAIEDVMADIEGDDEDDDYDEYAMRLHEKTGWSTGSSS